MLLQPNLLQLNNQTQWESLLVQPLSKRPSYQITGQSVSYTQIAGCFLGVFDDDEAYEEYIYTLVNEPSNEWKCLFKGLNREMDNQRFQDIQKVLNIYEKENLSINRLIAFLEGYNLFPFRNEKYQIHYRNTFKRVLELFNNKYGSTNNVLFKRIVVDLVKWSWNHLVTWNDVGFEEKVPRVFWYGDAKESEVYFLYFLYLFGCDVIVFHPEKQNIFSVLEQNDLQVVVYSSEKPLFEFPTRKPNRRSTIAQRASVELEEVLYEQTNEIFRPWQLREHLPRPITLRTTYDEIFILRPEKAMMRQGFKTEDGYVEIPNMFSKVAGITSNHEEYQSRLRKMVDSQKLIYAVNQFPLVERYKTNMQLHYRACLADERLDADKVISASFWPYKTLATHLQKGLAEVISRVVFEANLKDIPSEQLEQKRHYIFGQTMMIPQPLIRLIQQFDYSQEVPLLLLCNDDNNGQFTREDAVLLLILNQLGFDVLLFNPTGQNDIEQFIDESYYDTHWLDEMSFKEHFPLTLFLLKRHSKGKRKSTFKKIINKLF